MGGYSYLRSRGVTDEQIKLFRVGLGPKTARLPEESETGKRFNRQYRGTLEGRVIIPLYNCSGALRGILTRAWEERMFSTFYLDGWEEDAVLFGMPQNLQAIWETKTVFLVEGSFDFFPVQRVFPNTLSPLTAKLSQNQLRFLRRWAKNVVFLFDRDKKGMEYASKAVERFNVVGGEEGFMVHRLPYPAKDPGALYEMWGATKFAAHLRRQADGMNLYL